MKKIRKFLVVVCVFLFFTGCGAEGKGTMEEASIIINMVDTTTDLTEKLGAEIAELKQNLSEIKERPTAESVLTLKLFSDITEEKIYELVCYNEYETAITYGNTKVIKVENLKDFCLVMLETPNKHPYYCNISVEKWQQGETDTIGEYNTQYTEAKKQEFYHLLDFLDTDILIAVYWEDWDTNTDGIYYTKIRIIE